MGSVRSKVCAGVVGAIMAGSIVMGGASNAHATTILFDKSVEPQYAHNFQTICRNLGGTYYQFTYYWGRTHVKCWK